MTKNHGFQINFKAADLQDFIYTALATDIDLTIFILFF